MARGQLLLDEFIDVKVEKEKKEEGGRKERVEEGFKRVEAITETEEGIREARKSEKMHIIADLKDPNHESRCPYCDEWMGRLHAGALYLYTKHDGIYALADMDHIYDDCKHGLI